MTNTPVLIATFARPDYAKKTFAAVKKAKPKKLYFYSNKARLDRLDEVVRNDEVRELVKQVDWECELVTWFRDEYVDVYTSLLSAYDWVFENEEDAIVLEEDCVASLAFFDFCDQLLHRYKEDKKVWVISGNNFIEGYNPGGYDYIFSHFTYKYGWASWRDRWQNMEREGFKVNEIINSDLFRQIYCSAQIGKKQNETIKKYVSDDGLWRPVSWDSMLDMTILRNGGLTIVPLFNLVANIGVNGVNNIKEHKKIHNQKLYNKDKYIIENHPYCMVSDNRFTRRLFKDLSINKKSKVLKLFRYVFKKIGIYK